MFSSHLDAKQTKKLTETSVERVRTAEKCGRDEWNHHWCHLTPQKITFQSDLEEILDIKQYIAILFKGDITQTRALVVV